GRGPARSWSRSRTPSTPCASGTATSSRRSRGEDRMRVAVVGYGRMGPEIEAVLRERGHEPIVVRRGEAFPAGCPVGIDFTRAEAVRDNVARAMAAGARYVVGTTGWTDLDDIRGVVAKARGGLVHAANFSLGVNLFYRIVGPAARLLSRFPEYDPYVLDRHHRGKKDTPSGTARVLAGVGGAAGGAPPPGGRAGPGARAPPRLRPAPA